MQDVKIAGKFECGKIRCNPQALEKDQQMLLDYVRHNKMNPWTRIQNDVNIAMLNIRSIGRNLEHALLDGILTTAHTLCLVETWLGRNNLPPYCELYPYHAAVSSGKGKGCCVISKDTINVLGSVERSNVQWMKFVQKGKVIGLVYQSPTCSQQESKEMMAMLVTKERPSVVVGDFNTDAKTATNKNSHLLSMGYVQLISEPTHDEGGIIDHLYVDKAEITRTAYFLHSIYYSDHDAVCIGMEGNWTNII